MVSLCKGDQGVPCPEKAFTIATMFPEACSNMLDYRMTKFI
uniref:Uncharacterized protein n=1 Tax=Rhizophora mucronata TaxID=61149 RepID=A0A2P2Q8J9_RHIMU